MTPPELVLPSIRKSTSALVILIAAMISVAVFFGYTTLQSPRQWCHAANLSSTTYAAYEFAPYVLIAISAVASSILMKRMTSQSSGTLTLLAILLVISNGLLVFALVYYQFGITYEGEVVRENWAYIMFALDRATLGQMPTEYQGCPSTVFIQSLQFLYVMLVAGPATSVVIRRWREK